MKTAPFFIVGVQRSGTTLLRLLLNAHSDIAIPEEASFLRPLFKNEWSGQSITGPKLQRLVNYLRANEQFNLWNFDREPLLQEIGSREAITFSEVMDIMYSSYAKNEGKIRWGDKSLFFGSIEKLYEMFPKARFIHIVRDGRDVFHSWRKMDPAKSHPSVMALDWKLKLDFIERSIKTIPASNMLLVRYEDLLTQPNESLQKICNFLSIDFEEDMLRFHQSSNKYIGKHHSDLIFKAIDDSNITKWKKLLTQNEIDMYQFVAGKSLKKYGYEIFSGGLKIKTSILTGLDLLVGLPKRVIELIKVRLAFRRALREGEATKTIQVGELPKEQ